ncbi:MAG TPA: tetratricopeptide repeat protein, partial [Gemmatimonadaceae bacterium]|nr:tetratricopeptide repeat protein [Gemmatimonadaceae bacterium]
MRGECRSRGRFHPADYRHQGQVFMLRLRLQSIALACGASIILGACAGNPVVKTAPTSAPQSVPAAGPNRNATLAQADSAWQAGAYQVATEMYEGILARDPSSHIAMFRLATLRSWDSRFDEAITLFRRYVAVEPNYSGGRLAL